MESGFVLSEQPDLVAKFFHCGFLVDRSVVWRSVEGSRENDRRRPESYMFGENLFPGQESFTDASDSANAYWNRPSLRSVQHPVD